MRIEDAVLPRPEDVAEKGWSHGRLPVSTNGDWHEFASAWDDLPVDPYVQPSHRTSRYRRLGRLVARGDGSVERLPNKGFLQGKDVNRVYGGQVRVFEPILRKTVENACFQAAIAHDVDLIRQAEKDNAEWHITVHTILLTSTSTTSGGQAQTDIGESLGKGTGGSFETINVPSRLVTLLPEVGKKMAGSLGPGAKQFRVVVSRPGGGAVGPVGFGVSGRNVTNVSLEAK